MGSEMKLTPSTIYGTTDHLVTLGIALSVGLVSEGKIIRYGFLEFLTASLWSTFEAIAHRILLCR